MSCDIRVYRVQYRISTIILYLLQNRIAFTVMPSYERHNVNQFESFHEQLPLPVPCYDLLPVTELTVNHPRMVFGCSRLP